MIRNGADRRALAQCERTRLTERWQHYPPHVQEQLRQVLHDYGLWGAAQLTELLEVYTTHLANGERKGADRA